MYLLLILFLIFIVYPIIRAGWTVYRLRRQARQAFEQFNRANNPGAQADARRNRPAGWQPAPPHKKKISPDQGEYVRYEEISLTETTVVDDSETDKSTTSSTTIEQQITDIEWEDLPPQ